MGQEEKIVDPIQIAEFLRQLNRRRDLDSLAQWVLEYAVSLIPAGQAGSFLLFNEDEGVFEYRAAVGWDLAELSRIKIPRDQTLQARLGHLRPTIVRRPLEEMRDLIPPELREKLEKFPLAAFITFPIVFDGEVLAYFNVDNREDPNAFSQADIYRLAPLVEEIALAVHLEKERARVRRREELFHLVWNRLADALFITDFDGNILECNPAAERQTGYTRKELLRLNIMRDLAAEEPAITYEKVNEQLKRGEAVVFQERKRRKDGTLYWTECAVVQFEYRGKPATISVNRDITDRKRLEGELRRRLEELRAINRALRLIPSRLKLEAVIENVISTVRETTRADFAGLILFDEEGNPLRTVSPPGAPPIPLRMRPRGFTALVVNTKRPLVVHEIREDGSTEPPVLWPGESEPVPVHGLLRELGIKSLAALPVLGEDKVRAVLTLHSLRPRNFLGQEELLAALAPPIAVALDNALLYERTQEEERRYRHLFEESPVSLWVEDFSRVKDKLDALRAQGVEDLAGYLEDHPEFVDECLGALEVVEVNRATLRLYRVEDLEELKRRLPQLIPLAEVRPLLAEKLLAIWEGRQEFFGVGVNRRADGGQLHIHLSWRVFPGHEGDYGRVLVSLVDITDRVQAERRARAMADKLTALHRAVQSLQRCHTEEEVCQAAVEGAAEILGFPLCVISLVRGDQSVPVAWVGEVRPRPSPRGEGLAWRTLEERRSFWGNLDELPGAKPVDQRIKSGLSVPVGRLGVLQAAALKPKAFNEDDVRLAEILAGHVNEEIQRVRLERELREQVIRDPLTGLYNRRHLVQVLERELSRAKRYRHPLAVMIIDLDNFKQVNDRLGHLGGDRVLQGVAAMLRESVRESDLLFRYGGDEFVLVFPETDGQARRVANRLRRRLARWAAGQGFPELGLSVGTAIWKPEAPVEAEELLRQADARLYRAKRRKKLIP